MAAAVLAAPVSSVHAQQAPQKGPGWFVPGTPKPPVAPRPVAAAPAPAPKPPAGPAIPQLPALPHGQLPPAAVIGVLGVPQVMQASTAAQAVEKEIAKRRDALAKDAQKEQATWRAMQQKLASERSKLKPAEVTAREKALQGRITKAQQTFRDRNRRVQEAAQVALGKIERTLIAVIRQVAESRGMNLVLHRSQVALNMNQFDITQQVTQQLNKILPSVPVPPDSAFIRKAGPAAATAKK